jgi:hypothetical protein
MEQPFSMKTIIIWAAAALLTTSFAAKSTEANSPDGLYSIQSSRSGVSLVDSKGQSLITLIRSTTGGTKIEISWAPTSKRVVLATNSALGSAIVAAWTDDNGATWTKALEADADQTNISNQAQRDTGSRLIAESLTLGDWGSPDELQVKGNMKFSNHKQAEFSYGLEFGSGVLVAKDYKFTLPEN